MSYSQYYTNKYKESLEATKESGFVELITPPLIYVKGLPGAFLKEVVYFEAGYIGIVMSLAKDLVEVLVFTNDSILLGSQVSRSGYIMSVPVGTAMLGHTVDPLGRSIYDNVSGIDYEEYRPIEQKPLGIEHREKISAPMITGVSVVDLMIPLGMGQRELVLGDRKIGKTIFLLQTLLSQASKGCICIYAAIGRHKSDIKEIESFAVKNNFRDKLIILASSSSDAAAYIYICPYSAMSLAEYFRDKGHDVLLILDDLTSHAKYYREIALLGGRFPGRNSYPGDIFHLHARLLERAGNFKTAFGSKSITCLPVVETVEGDISGYVQTNLMSITDGHVFFDRELFKEGRRPAVNYSLSVTRVGRQTQTKLRWAINRELNSFLSLYDKTLDFIHFGAEINEGIKSTLAMGNRIINFFDQPMGVIVDSNVQIALFCLIWGGFLNHVDVKNYKKLIRNSVESYNKNPQFKDMLDKIIFEVKDFNGLLGLLSSKHKDILAYISV